MTSRSGTVLREPGMALTSPIVARPHGAFVAASAKAPSIIGQAARQGSRRISIGVGPAWQATPSRLTSSQYAPCMPVTTPIVVPVFSRMGPCSMCASNIAWEGRGRAGAVPR